LVKSQNLGQKSKFWSKIEILAKNRNYGQKSKFWLKSKFWSKNKTLCKSFLVKIQIIKNLPKRLKFSNNLSLKSNKRPSQIVKLGLRHLIVICGKSVLLLENEIFENSVPIYSPRNLERLVQFFYRKKFS